MADDMLKFELVSPERLLMELEVAMVVVPGTEGDFGVLAQHAPVVSTIRPGMVEVYEAREAEPSRFFLKGGFAEVSPEGLVILAEDAVDPAEVDPSELAQRIADAREDLEDAADEAARAKVEKDLAWMTALDALVR